MKNLGFLLIFYSLHMFSMNSYEPIESPRKKLCMSNSAYFVSECCVKNCTLPECKELKKQLDMKISTEEKTTSDQEIVGVLTPISFEKFLAITNERFDKK